jgi:tripartite-type tricarboxylate transporter receptor subunit TctC
MRFETGFSSDPKRPSSAKQPRRRFLTLAVGAATLPAVSRIASAQTYPTRPITMIVPFPGMSTWLGRPIIIENISGADGSIGTGRAARARPDGYTIIVGQTSTFVLSPHGGLYAMPSLCGSA